jgi:hypothetical protein
MFEGLDQQLESVLLGLVNFTHGRLHSWLDG